MNILQKLCLPLYAKRQNHIKIEINRLHVAILQYYDIKHVKGERVWKSRFISGSC